MYCFTVFPQVLTKQPHGTAVDIYSMGCFYLEMSVGVPVQTKRTKGEQKRKRCEELRIAKEKIEGNWKETLLRHPHVSFILK